MVWSDSSGRQPSPWSGGVMVIIWAVNSSSKYLVSVSEVTWGLKGGLSCRVGVAGRSRAGSALLQAWHTHHPRGLSLPPRLQQVEPCSQQPLQVTSGSAAQLGGTRQPPPTHPGSAF